MCDDLSVYKYMYISDNELLKFPLLSPICGYLIVLLVCPLSLPLCLSVVMAEGKEEHYNVLDDDDDKPAITTVADKL